MKFLFGYVVFSLTGGLENEFLNQCLKNEIALTDLKATPFGITGVVPAGKYKQICKIAKKCGGRVRMQEKHGLPFLLHKHSRRYGLVAGAAFFVFCAWYTSFFVWNVQFYGLNQQQIQILQPKLIELNLVEGARVTDDYLRVCEEEILFSSPEFGWVSINFVKGRLVVEASIATPKPKIDGNEITQIRAGLAGEIVSMEVYGGTATKKVGDSVEAGELLVEGVYRTPYITRYFFEQPQHSTAKILAKVECVYSSEVQLESTALLPFGQRVEQRIYTVLGRCFVFGTLPGDDTLIVRNEKEKITFLGFSLPVSCQVVTGITLVEAEVSMSAESAAAYCAWQLGAQAYRDFALGELLYTTGSSYEENGIFHYTLTAGGILNIAVEEAAVTAPKTPQG